MAEIKFTPLETERETDKPIDFSPVETNKQGAPLNSVYYLKDSGEYVTLPIDVPREEAEKAVKYYMYGRGKYVNPALRNGVFDKGFEEDPVAVKELGKGLAKGVLGIEKGFNRIIEWTGDIAREIHNIPFRIVGNTLWTLFPEKMAERQKNLKPTIGIPAAEEKFITARIASTIQNVGRENAEWWDDRIRTGVLKPNQKLMQGSFLENPSFLRAGVIIIEAVPSVGAAFVASVATGNPWVGAGFLGALESSEMQAEARKAGLGTFEATFKVGLPAFIAITALEKAPFDFFLGGGTKVTKKAFETIGKEGGKAARSFLRRKLTLDAIYGFASESAQEVSQQFVQNMIAKFEYDPTRNLFEGMIESLIAGGATGFALGGFTSGRGANIIDDIVKDAKSKGVTDEELNALWYAAAQTVNFNSELINKGLMDRALTVSDLSKKIMAKPPILKEVTQFEMETMIAEAEKAGLLITEEELSKIIEAVPEETIEAIRKGVKELEKAPEITPELIVGAIKTIQEIQEDVEKIGIMKQLELEETGEGQAEITPAIQESFEPTITPEQKTEAYRQNLEIKKEKRKVINIVKDGSRKTGTSFKEFANKAFVPISTRLSKIDVRLKHVLRKYEFFTNLRTKRDSETAIPFLEKYQKLSREDASTLDFALKNRDIDIVNEILKRNNLTEEFNEITSLLDDIFARAKDVGLDVNYLIDYFPRKVDDISGFLNFIRSTENWSAIEEAIKAQEKEQGYIMDDSEKVEFINKIIRGFGRTQIRLNIPSNVKNRLITRITPEMNLFYKDSSQALLDYISSLNNAIEARKFFGKGKDIDESIGRYIKILIDERVISATDEKEVRDILKARFEQSGTHGWWQTYKNLSYIYAMGSPISAITQIGDQAFSLYKNGAYRTLVGVLKSVTNRSTITKEDLGIEVIAQEFADPSRSSKAVSKVFKGIGLEWIDRIGKESLIDGALNRLSKKAKENDAGLKNELELVFGDQANKVFEDLKNKNLTDNVKYLMFSELADVQPIALSEMPEYYLNGGNLRIFYMLKTYTLKLIDIYHNDVFMQMKTNPVKGLKNLIKLTASLALMGVTSDVIKDLLLGRDIELDDLVIDNLLKLLGFNRWQLYKARQDGLIAAFMRSILPPVPFLDDVYKDIVNRRKFPDWRIIGRIPFVGKFYYWWFGGGKRFTKRGEKKPEF